MSEQKERLLTLVDDLKSYLNVRLQLISLSISEMVARLLASLISNGAMLFFIALFLLFGSFAAAFGLGQWLNSYALGFILVAGFYLLLGLIIYFIKGRYIEKPLINLFIRLFLKNMGDEEDNKSNEENRNT